MFNEVPIDEVQPEAETEESAAVLRPDTIHLEEVIEPLSVIHHGVKLKIV